VGGNAQIKSMKKIAGTLKVDQAQYRELEAFSKFGSDLDATTLAILNKGAKNVEILKQGQYMPMPVEKQIAIIYCGTMGLLKDVPVTKVKEFEKEYLEYLDLKHKDILNDLRDGILTDDMTKVLEKVAMELASKYEPQ
jgi:F-type H+-transporting ATPase subunit alpha